MSLQPPKAAFPAVNSPQRAGNDGNGNAKNPVIKTRNKVKLAQGFGLHDWVKLTREKSDLADVGGQLHKITPKELSKHCTKDNCWMALRGKVCNITRYMNYHPGGVDELMRVAGKDGTDLFNEIHQWVNADSMLEKCLVGFLVPDYNSNNNNDDDDDEYSDNEDDGIKEHHDDSKRQKDKANSNSNSNSKSKSKSKEKEKSEKEKEKLKEKLKEKKQAHDQHHEQQHTRAMNIVSQLIEKSSSHLPPISSDSSTSSISSTTSATLANEAIDLPPVRYDWYETASHLVIILYVKGVAREDIISDQITPTSTSLEVMVAPESLQPPTPPVFTSPDANKFLDPPESPKPPSPKKPTQKYKLFFRVDFKVPILPEQSITTFNALKLGVSLKKENPGQMLRDLNKAVQMWVPFNHSSDSIASSVENNGSDGSVSTSGPNSSSLSKSITTTVSAKDEKGSHTVISTYLTQHTRFVLGKITYIAKETYNTFWMRVLVPLPLPILRDGVPVVNTGNDHNNNNNHNNNNISNNNSFNHYPSSNKKQIQPISVIGLGQHVDLAVSIEGTHVSRPYTPVRVSVLPDGRTAELEFLIKRYDDGTLTPVLNELKPGDTLDVSGALGLAIDLQLYTHIGMVAGGTGITPMLRILRACDNENVTRTATGKPLITVSLIFCNTSTQDILAKEELDEYAALAPWFSLHHVFKYPPSEPFGTDSRVTTDYGLINSKVLKQRLSTIHLFTNSPNLSPAITMNPTSSLRSYQPEGPYGAHVNECIFICGRPSFTRDVGRLLKEELHVPPQKVHAFTG